MNRAILMLLAVISLSVSAQTLSKRVVPNNPANYRLLSSVHAGPGK